MHEAWGEDEESSSPSKVSWSHEPQVYHIMGLGNQDEPHDDDGFQRPRGKVLVQGSPIAPCIVLSDYDEGPKAEKEDAENRKFALPDQKRRKVSRIRLIRIRKSMDSESHDLTVQSISGHDSPGGESIYPASSFALELPQADSRKPLPRRL